MAKKKKNNNSIPEVGKKYHFFDDGKVGPSRHYIATIEEIITTDESKQRYFKSFTTNTIRPLYDIWQSEVKSSSFLYAATTDVFVRCSIPKYDKHPIWFVRTKEGGLFSIDVESGWQSGRLDIDGSIYKAIKEEMDEKQYPGWYDEKSETEIIN